MGHDHSDGFCAPQEARRDLASIIEAHADSIARRMEQQGRGEHASAAQAALKALPRHLVAATGRPQNGSCRKRTPAAIEVLSPTTRYFLLQSLSRSAWAEAVAQAPGEWTLDTAEALRNDLEQATCVVLANGHAECTANPEELLRQMQEDHLEFCGHILQEYEVQRGHLARQIHDVVAQALAAARYHANVTRRMATGDVDRAAAEAEETEKLIEHALAAIRDVVEDLRPVLGEGGCLREAFDAYAVRLADQAGICLTLWGKGDAPPLDAVTRVVLFRSLQDVCEGLLAPVGATAASVSFHVRGGIAKLIVREEGERVTDDESSPQTRQLKERISLIRRRADLVAGLVTADVRPGSAMQVEIRVPVHERGA